MLFPKLSRKAGLTTPAHGEIWCEFGKVSASGSGDSAAGSDVDGNFAVFSTNTGTAEVFERVDEDFTVVGGTSLRLEVTS